MEDRAAVALPPGGDGTTEVASRIASIEDTLHKCYSEIEAMQDHLSDLPGLCKMLNLNVDDSTLSTLSPSKVRPGSGDGTRRRCRLCA